MTRRTVRTLALVVGLAPALLPARGAAQDLADFDYENLSFRGIGLEVGRMYATRVDPTRTLTARLDLGYLGPGVRIIPSVTYWSSAFKTSEVTELRDQVAQLIADQTGGPAPAFTLGPIDWTDVVVSLDAQVVWRIPFGVLTFAGVGGSAHVLDGSGPAIDNTLVEDLLDSVTAGFNLHWGLEYPLVDQLRIFGQTRYEVLGDMQYVQLGLGVQFLLGPLAPGEERAR